VPAFYLFLFYKDSSFAFHSPHFSFLLTMDLYALSSYPSFLTRTAPSDSRTSLPLPSHSQRGLHFPPHSQHTHRLNQVTVFPCNASSSFFQTIFFPFLRLLNKRVCVCCVMCVDEENIKWGLCINVREWGVLFPETANSSS